MPALHRRALLAGSALALARPLRAAADTIFRLWPDTPPGAGGPAGPIVTTGRGAIHDIATPTLEMFAPVEPNGAAMLIAAGGGYKRIEMESEARPAARWLASRGITAFVLAYRLPTEGWAAGPLAPLQDAQRAMRLIRAQATTHHFDPARIGGLGFSAGGHLVGMTAFRADPTYAPVDSADSLSARPTAAALIYPVITLEPPYDHTSTRRSLIGQRPDAASSAAWSVQTHIRPGDPSLFLAQADDDPISDPANSLIAADACRRAGVPVEIHRLPTGGHGFGMGQPGTPTGAWPAWYEAWLHAERLL